MTVGNPPTGDTIFLVQCADGKYLAIRGGDGRWKSYHDDADLPDVAAVIIPVPIELILPFLPALKRKRVRVVSGPAPR